MIPITNLSRHNGALLPDILDTVQDVIRLGALIKGPFLEQFEMEFASYLGTRHCMGVNSGTDALFLALKALGVGPGDEVITTAMSFVATAEAIALTGAKPVFCDIGSDVRDLIDVDQLPTLITPQTKAIVPVHLHGYACDMVRIMDLAADHQLYVVEDCAQATGAFLLNQAGVSLGRLGSFGHAGCFSFFPTKNLGALGDGGAIVTNDDDLAQAVQDLREHGGKKNQPHRVGYNSRLDALQAAVLSVKLPYLDEWNVTRLALAQRYHDQIIGATNEGPLRQVMGYYTLPPIDSNGVFHHYPVRVPAAFRPALQERLKARGIETISYYPHALPLLSPYVPAHVSEEAETQWKQKWHSSEAHRQALTGFSLPIFPELTSFEQERIVYWFTHELLELVQALGS